MKMIDRGVQFVSWVSGHLYKTVRVYDYLKELNIHSIHSHSPISLIVSKHTRSFASNDSKAIIEQLVPFKSSSKSDNGINVITRYSWNISGQTFRKKKSGERFSGSERHAEYFSSLLHFTNPLGFFPGLCTLFWQVLQFFSSATKTIPSRRGARFIHGE